MDQWIEGEVFLYNPISGKGSVVDNDGRIIPYHASSVPSNIKLKEGDLVLFTVFCWGNNQVMVDKMVLKNGS